ncbi:MAG: anti-sigma factor [Gammaproteobacteria bacterium]
MSAGNLHEMARLDELLADEAAAALDTSDAPEIRQLLARHAGVDRNSLIQVAALAQVAFLRRDPRSLRTAAGTMPPGLRERLASQGKAVAVSNRGPAIVRSTAPARATVPGRSRGAFGILGGTLGWALAAGLAVALVLVRNEALVTAPATERAATTRADLLAGAPDVVTLPWAAPSAAGYEGVTGDVVWSPSRQQGYLRLANMPVNDPARLQYQLWIVDPSRDTHPVDGGVFNVSATGEVVIPIHARLPIRSPRAFAITAEQPGGVVVSAGPLLVVAST